VANESGTLPDCLQRIDLGNNEVLVVDAGSVDDTREIATAAGCRVISVREPHRARQMNVGAGEAHGRILLFLHADTWLPAGALDRIRSAIDQLGAVGGGFARRYRSPSRILHLTCRLAGLRSRVLGWHLGDQALFVRRDLFQQLDGYRDIPIFEDLDFSRRFCRLGKTVTLAPPVSSSARRFDPKGPLRTTWEDLLLTRKYLSGNDPNELCQTASARLKALQTYERLS
jgi:rSAM/selenodomain-associated transferase 2